mmetsp:Transcript_56985/g.114273  ORF Transcript_56985/g.114273 Transcript_56985/m.114273 type:complete len:132 (+) Transcript_56985:372-767(+)
MARTVPQAIVPSPTTTAPSSGDSREAGSHTVHSLSCAPHKSPRLTGMNVDFSHARGMAAATAATRSTKPAADSRDVRGFSKMEVAARAGKATEATAAAVALAKTTVSSAATAGAQDTHCPRWLESLTQRHL